MKTNLASEATSEEDSLVPEVYDYLTKFDFPLAYIIQKKFKIGFTRAEKILRQIEAKKHNNPRI